MENNTQEIGHYLKMERENRKVSIEEVAYKTKINLNVLKHLEASELNHLPNKTYVRGFVKNYCKILGVDENKALDILDQTYGTTLEQKIPEANVVKIQKTDQPAKQSEDDEREEFNDKLLIMARSLFNKKVLMAVTALGVAALIINALVSFFTNLSNEQKQLAKEIQTESEQVTSSNVTEDILPVLIQDETIKAANTNLFESKKLIDMQQSSVIEVIKEEKPRPKAEAKIEKIKEEKPLEVKKEVTQIPSGKFPFIKFSKAPEVTYNTDPKAQENTKEDIFPARYRQSMDPTKANVFIHATNDDTWISYQVDDEEIKRYVLKKGRSVFLKGEVVLLFMGNVNSTKIFYNNELVTVDSKTGVKSFIFPNSRSADFELPLFPAYKGVPYKAQDYKANMVDE
jgi:cytoskeleton protein RodZ